MTVLRSFEYASASSKPVKGWGLTLRAPMSGLLAAMTLVCVPALAQNPPPKTSPGLSMPTASSSLQQQQAAAPSPQVRAAYDKAFQLTLQKPADPDTLARFAELAVQVGDIEGAISALERLLLIERDQPEVKLELGVLYYRLGSKEAAMTYLEAAHASPEASPQTRQRAETFLKAARR